MKIAKPGIYQVKSFDKLKKMFHTSKGIILHNGHTVWSVRMESNLDDTRIISVDETGKWKRWAISKKIVKKLKKLPDGLYEIKTWEEMAREYELDYDGDIMGPDGISCFLRGMNHLLPVERTIAVRNGKWTPETDLSDKAFGIEPWMVKRRVTE